MEEMQRLIGRRAQENPAGRPRPLSMVTDPVLPKTADLVRADDVAKSMDELASHVDHDLMKAIQHLDHVTAELPRLTSTLAEVNSPQLYTGHPLNARSSSCRKVTSWRRLAMIWPT